MFFLSPSDQFNEYQLNLLIARDLSIMLQCRTICDGSFHGDDTSPFWSIIWDQGQPYLADDCNSVFGDYYDGISVEEIAELNAYSGLHQKRHSGIVTAIPVS